MNKQLNFQRGFTLLELAGVLMVSSVLAGMGIPMVTDIKNSMAGETVQDKLALSLSEARAHAVSAGVQVSVCASHDGERCVKGAWSKGWLAYHGKPVVEGEVVDKANVIHFVRVENDEIEVSLFDDNLLDVSDVRFNDQGFTVEQTKISGEVCRSGKTLLSEYVNVERSGRVRVLARASDKSERNTFCS